MISDFLGILLFRVVICCCPPDFLEIRSAVTSLYARELKMVVYSYRDDRIVIAIAVPVI